VSERRKQRAEADPDGGEGGAVLLEELPADRQHAGREHAKGELDAEDPAAGDDDFEIIGDPSADQQAGLEQIREFIADYGGTGVQQAIETALFDVLDCIAVFPGSANGSDEKDGVFRDCFILPADATTEDFAYFLHSDIGDGLLHGIDCRTERQVGADHDLTHRDVVEIVSTN